MGCDIHITRAPQYWESENYPISLEEWIELVENDPSLNLDPEAGEGFAIWKGECQHGDETWFAWSYGSINTTNPDPPILRKALEIAKSFGAQVQDDDCQIYEDDSGYPIRCTGPQG